MENKINENLDEIARRYSMLIMKEAKEVNPNLKISNIDLYDNIMDILDPL
jgi:hypothetical protein